MRSQDVVLATAGTICITMAAVVLWRQDAAVKDPDPARYNVGIAAFSESDRLTAAPSEGILFVGSSSISLWPADSLFAGLPVINRGLGGAHISDINYLIDELVLPYAPRTVVFYAGDNDINDRKTPERVVEDFERFLRLLRRSNPESRVLFLSIKPSQSRWQVWPEMQKTNQSIARLAAGDSRLSFVDVATPLLDSDGKPNASLFLDDSLHLNAAGYRVWTDILRPYLTAKRTIHPASQN